MPNDRFVDSVASFVKVANFSVKECEEEFNEMKERVSINFLHHTKASVTVETQIPGV